MSQVQFLVPEQYSCSCNSLLIYSIFFSENKENLLLAWELESDHQGVLNLKWLRENCYSEPARKIQSEMRRTQPHLGQVFSPPDNNQTMMLRTSEKITDLPRRGV